MTTWTRWLAALGVCASMWCGPHAYANEQADSSEVATLERQRLDNLIKRVELYLLDERFDEALKTYGDLLSAEVKDEELEAKIISRGRDLAIIPLKQLERPGTTVDLARRLLERTGDDAILFRILSEAYAAQGKGDAANQWLDKARSHRVDDTGYRYSVGLFFQRHGMEAIAEEEYLKILGVPELSSAMEANAHWRLAEIAYWREAYERSVEHYDQVMELFRAGGFDREDYPALTQQVVYAYLSLSRYWQHRDDWPKALEAAQHCERYAGNEPLVLNAIGECYRELDDLGRALVYYNRSLRLDGDKPETHIGLGDVCLARGDAERAEEHFDKAVGLYKKVIRDDPDDASNYNNLAWFYALHDRDLDEGVELSKKSLELRPDQEEYLDTLAELYYRKGDYGAAIREIKRALDLEPRHRIYFEKQREKFEKGKRGGAK